MTTEIAHDWGVYETEGFPHVIPHNDLREHTVSPGCWCSPTEDEGMIVHHSMDRREEFERGERRPV